MDFDIIKSYLKENLSEYRYNHTLRVVDMGVILADKFSYKNLLKVKTACYFHDIGKELSSYEILKIVTDEGHVLNCDEVSNVHIYHGIASMTIARDRFKVDDIEILNAIKNHVTGSESMTMLDKIVFLADFIEIGRDYNVVCKSRDAALVDLNLNEALVCAYDSIIQELLSKRKFIHEDTLKARNFILSNINRNY